MTKPTAMIITIDFADYLVEDREDLVSLLKALPSMVKLRGEYKDSRYVYYKDDLPDFGLKLAKAEMVFESKEAFEAWKESKDKAADLKSELKKEGVLKFDEDDEEEQKIKAAGEAEAFEDYEKTGPPPGEKEDDERIDF